MVGVASYLLDSSRDPKAAGPPAPEDAAIRGPTLHLVFETLPTEAHRALVECVVEEQRSGPNGVMFRAAQRVTRGEENIDPEFIRAQEPALLEVAPDHFVACDLYPRPYRADGGLNRLTRGTRPTRG